MIAQAVISALLTICTLAAWHAVTALAGMARARRRRSVDADAVARGAAAAAASTPDQITAPERSRQHHEQLVADLRQTT
ncbi:hypothetical protein KGQ20_39815 [Catenulispora sp. NF23]|uniref:hypothetical protein n=1 Tax=Catenulispora pinistramenti TaxID=2705254 RepID=UPI001BAB2564|nr:hypothetical protein [Catenulispora pinistramenti]MBS2538912.1 hypothetical protein [Catenulispora pinistramenti]